MQCLHEAEWETGELFGYGEGGSSWLRKLADHLAATPVLHDRDRFNMGVWWQRDTEECSTVGCAIGWGIRDEVTPAGLGLRQVAAESDCICSGCNSARREAAWIPTFDVAERRHVGFAAIAAAYQVPEWLVAWMFDPDEYWGRSNHPGPVRVEEVVSRLRAAADALDVTEGTHEVRRSRRIRERLDV